MRRSESKLIDHCVIVKSLVSKGTAFQHDVVLPQTRPFPPQSLSRIPLTADREVERSWEQHSVLCSRRPASHGYGHRTDVLILT
jgi:hypothetical protein